MERERNSIRHYSELLPESLSKVTISWGADSSIESDVANCCSHGIRVLTPPLQLSTNIPKKNDTVKVLIPIGQVWISGMCVYTTNELYGSVSMGIYFYHPSEQNYLNNLLSKTLNVPLQAGSFVSHEWEELVARLCDSEDPKLKDIGHHEVELLKHSGKGL